MRTYPFIYADNSQNDEPDKLESTLTEGNYGAGINSIVGLLELIRLNVEDETMTESNADYYLRLITNPITRHEVLLEYCLLCAAGVYRDCKEKYPYRGYSIYKDYQKDSPDEYKICRKFLKRLASNLKGVNIKQGDWGSFFKYFFDEDTGKQLNVD